MFGKNAPKGNVEEYTDKVFIPKMVLSIPNPKSPFNHPRIDPKPEDVTIHHSTAIGHFAGSPRHPTELWKWAKERTGNQKGPWTPHIPKDERFVDSMNRHQRFSQHLARRLDPTYDPETDTVELSRGLSGPSSKEILDKKKKNSLQDQDIYPSAVESWSSDPGSALAFSKEGSDGVVLKKRHPVSRIASHWLAGPYLLEPEREVLILHQDTEKYKSDEIHDSSSFVPEDMTNKWAEKFNDIKRRSY